MNVCFCRTCRKEVSPDLLTCPDCGTPRPAQADWNGEGYEWKSTGTWMGSPLVHIAFGIAPDGKMRVAKGLIAIGQRATGGVAIGIIASGFLSIGVVCFGVFSLGIISLGLCAAAGINAIAPLAFGITAFGFRTGGMETLGWRH